MKLSDGLMLCMAFSALTATASASVPYYTLYDLGALPGSAGGEGFAINEVGEAVGVMDGNGTPQDPLGSRAFLYRSGSLIDLSVALGSPQYSSAVAVNLLGQVAGHVTDTAGTRGFIYSGGRAQVFGWPGSTYTYLQNLNNCGQAVGAFDVPGPTFASHALLRQRDGTLVDLGTFGGQGASAVALNDVGQVVVNSYRGSGDNRAFVTQSVGGVPQDLGALRGSTYAYAINEIGQVVGKSGVDGDLETFYHAVRFAGGTLRDLGTLPRGSTSFALGINNWGQIVGGGDGYDFSEHGWVYVQGQMYDLNDRLSAPDTGWVVTEARAINDAGQIVGTAMDAQGITHAVILSPSYLP